ncbi:leucine-rich repeat domain-containing protein [Dyadobacter diqingensis]|uniref:leucine-rich repeat domain-containing protein n=1 Tax=Dyadobacter diqingensis TaxID=2938121 RepID=UPI0020C39432|nr:leucine-rich repeat domain-containing protein [Dyadobacter diqingensis]
MNLKITSLMLSAASLLFTSFFVNTSPPEKPIDRAWWDALTDEWKNILLINQSFSRQQINIYTIQKEYINRLNTRDEQSLSEMNTSLYDLHEAEQFGLSYQDMYARAIRRNHLIPHDQIDLETLEELDTLYMVNGPGDLSPLTKLPNLRVLIINYCGIGYNIPIKEQILDLTPLKNLKKLRVLHCASSAVRSLEPIRNLTDLEELVCDNTSIKTLSPLRKLTNLRILSFGSNVAGTADIGHLVNLEALYIKGSKPLSGVSKLKKLKKLSIAENELSIVNPDYRYNDIRFLENFEELTFLDMQHTSYHGTLHALSELKNLKAVTLPRAPGAEVSVFKQRNPNCLITNLFTFEN